VIAPAQPIHRLLDRVFEETASSRHALMAFGVVWLAVAAVTPAGSFGRTLGLSTSTMALTLGVVGYVARWRNWA